MILPQRLQPGGQRPPLPQCEDANIIDYRSTTDDEMLLLEPLSVLQERFHWSEIEAMAQLRELGKRMLWGSLCMKRASTVMTAEEMRSAKAASEVGKESTGRQSATHGEYYVEVETEEDVEPVSRGVEMHNEASSSTSSHEISLLSVMSTSAWDLMKNLSHPSAPSSLPFRGVSPPLATGLPQLDETLLGGLRPQFLTEFISPRRISSSFSSFSSCTPCEGAYSGPYQEGGSSGSGNRKRKREKIRNDVCLPFSTHTSLFGQPNRLLLAQIALNILHADSTAVVWWLHPSPGDDTLQELFQCLGKGSECSPSRRRSNSVSDTDDKKRISTAEEKEDEEKTKKNHKKKKTEYEEDTSWTHRLLISPLSSFSVLLQVTQRFAKRRTSAVLGSTFSSPSSSSSSSSSVGGDSASPSPRIRLVVIEELSFLLRRGSEVGEVSTLTTADGGGGAGAVSSSCVAETFIQLQTLVELWKQIAYTQHIVVVFLNTSNVSCTVPAMQIPGARTSPTTGKHPTTTTTFTHSPISQLEFALDSSHELGRGFSHAMNIRFVLFPGWMIAVTTTTARSSSTSDLLNNHYSRTAPQNTEHPPSFSNNLAGKSCPQSDVLRIVEGSPTEEKYSFFQIKVLKSPLSGGVVLSFRLKSLSPQVKRLSEVKEEEEEKEEGKRELNGRVGKHKRWIWMPFSLMTALDPLDYILPA